MLKKMVILLLFMIGNIQSVATFLPTQVDLVKKKWMDKMNSDVDAEQVRFLRQYGLDLSCLNDPELIDEVKKGQDQLVRKMLEPYQSRPIVNQEELNIVQDIASKIFKESNIDSVVVVDFVDGDYEHICVLQIHDTNTCYVGLNCSQHVINKELLAAALKHECSHIVHQDPLNKGMISFVAWCNSNDTRDEVTEKSNPFSRLCETRADVYAAVNSLDHGMYLIEFLKKVSNDVFPTHPETCDRIALLEQIKLELDVAYLQDRKL